MNYLIQKESANLGHNESISKEKTKGDYSELRELRKIERKAKKQTFLKNF